MMPERNRVLWWDGRCWQRGRLEGVLDDLMGLRVREGSE